ncbi:MAG: hypothetical protein V4480_04515 [Patescibacteria group bacterium]
MRKVTLALLAASVSIIGGAAHAQTASQKSDHSWHNWGAAPFAPNERDAFSDAKIDKFLADAMNGPTHLSAQCAVDLKAEIRAHPDGKIVYLDPDDRLAMMESRDGPMYDVPVAALPVSSSPNVVKAARAREYRVKCGDQIVVAVVPFICGNWSIYFIKTETSQEGCAVIELSTEDATDKHSQDVSIGFAEYGYYSPATLCNGYREVGQTKWWPMPVRCPTANCYDAIDREIGMQRVQSGGWLVRPGASYEVLVPKYVATSTTNLWHFCLRRKNSRENACGVMVRHDDYHDWHAVIFYDQDKFPADWKWRRLYWTVGCDPRLIQLPH